jgi:hypothetical protein
VRSATDVTFAAFMASANSALVRGTVNGQGQMHARSTFRITSNARANSKQTFFSLRRSDTYAPVSRVRVQNQHAVLQTGWRSNAAKPSVTTFATSKQAHHSSEQSSLSEGQHAQDKARVQDDKETGQETEATGHEAGKVGDEAGGIRDAQEGVRDEADEKLEKIHEAGMEKDREEEHVEKRVKDRRAGAWS